MDSKTQDAADCAPHIPNDYTQLSPPAGDPCQPPGPFPDQASAHQALHTDLTLYPEDNTVGKSSRSDLVPGTSLGLGRMPGFCGGSGVDDPNPRISTDKN